MSDFALRAGQKLFAQHLQQYEPVDPYYETYTDKKGRQKRRKRELPPGLSERDQKILRSVKRRAYHLDRGFRVCGMRFGWTFVVGVVPGAGDVANALLNYILVVRKAQEAGIPGWLLQRMLLNNAVSAGVGFVPFMGDIVVAVYKANWRNAALLDEFLRIRGEEFLRLEAERAKAEPQVPPPPARRSTSWWRRGTTKDKGKVKDAEKQNGKGAQPLDAPDPGRGRFVEDVPGPVADTRVKN